MPNKTFFLLFGFLTALLAIPASARDASFILRVESRSLKFVTDASQRLTLSAECFTKSGAEKSCGARTVFKQIPLLVKRESLAAFKNGNPGALICQQVLRRSLRVGVDSKGSEQAFCQMDDGSMIDTGSIAFAWYSAQSPSPNP
jgi:hypothetical protein